MKLHRIEAITAGGRETDLQPGVADCLGRRTPSDVRFFPTKAAL